ncbi:MAG TPA: glycine cleavage T C-terminal barrel domain-containing protein [Candidatus Acidoferrales bacterium]|nr:glycine cleavage T C-terminal barrel domain-containing protein [Candidatus Acidoferrales bacterium]
MIGLQTDDGRMVARQGYRIFREGVEAGVITSGTFAPSIQRPIAMAYVTNAAGKNSPATGEMVEVEIRNRKTSATVVRRPFYRRDGGHAASTASV